MVLYDQILAIYTTLKLEDFDPITGTIYLQNDGNGDYIKTWTNNNPQPTETQLQATGK